jgi:hypothetical protein
MGSKVARDNVELCNEIKDDVRHFVEKGLDPHASEREVRDVLGMCYNVELPGFDYTVNLIQVVAPAETPGYCQLRLASYQIRRIRVGFEAAGQRIRSKVTIGRYEIGFGPARDGFTVV